MKKTFKTSMPDRHGEFLKAIKCITVNGLNITRVSYNKAVDSHITFIEIEGENEKLKSAEKELSELGYLGCEQKSGSVILIEFRLPDQNDALIALLKLIDKYGFNISYADYRKNNFMYQSFKMGLFSDDNEKISDFIKQASIYCCVEVIEYDKSEKVLDNTVCYLSFIDEISKKRKLSEMQKEEILINANIIMQMLDQKNKSPYKTFKYIGRAAELISKYKGDKFNPRISEGKTKNGISYIFVEPPCGSNVLIFDFKNSLLFIDSGFECYKTEMELLLKKFFPDFEKKKKYMRLTHTDIDHCGCADFFDEIYLSFKSYHDFLNDKNGKGSIREKNVLHAPYMKISKILSDYKIPDIKKLKVIGGDDKKINGVLEKISDFKFESFNFEVYEGYGGHVEGETVYVERNENMVFTGDIIVNIKGFTKEQASYNKLAPYLMNSVDSKPENAKSERDEILKILGKGKWKTFTGHGRMFEINNL